jgi:hypothetical protein
MRSIRIWLAGAGALSAAIALALASAPVVAEESHSSPVKFTPKFTFVATAAAPSAACLAARQALVTGWTKDQDEDTAERQAAKLAGATPARDVDEDKAERAAWKALSDATKTACAGQPATPASSACVSAKAALKSALTAAKAAEQAEKASGAEASASDKAEDKAERAALKPLWTAVKTNCGFASAGSTGSKTFTFEGHDRR